MIRAAWIAIALAAFAASGALATPAHAEAPGGHATAVSVLSIWTDDADDQADALTQALRSRVRQAQGWSLLEAPESFETLAIALKCPSKPDPPCLERIADQLRVDHYVWGTMSRHKDAAQVAADLHLWSRGKGDVEAKATYSDGMKDASGAPLRAIAAQLFATLNGTGAVATLLVRTGNAGGTLLVDGTARATLESGVARIDLTAGPHTITVRAAGYQPASQTTDLPPGSQQDLTFQLAPTPRTVPGEHPKAAFPVRRALAYSALLAGAGFFVASGIEAVNWVDDSNKSDADRSHVVAPGQTGGVGDVCADPSNVYAADACMRSKDARTVSTLAWVFGGVGAVLIGTGVGLLVSDHSSNEPRRDAAARVAPREAVDLVPLVGLRGGSVDVRFHF